MYRASNAYSVLQAIAVTAGLALIFWSIGLPSLRIAEAAAVTSFSDTLSDSTPNAPSDHTIEYVATSGVASTSSIVLTFDASFDLSEIGEEDVDLFEGVVDEGVGTNWSLSTTSNSITLTSTGGEITAGATTTIYIGTVAAGGNSQITNPNPASPTSYEVAVASGDSDTGVTEVVIIPSVTVSAAVDTVFTFAVNGVAGGTAVGGTYSTGGGSSTTSIPFGEIAAGPGNATTAAQELAVSTNANNGFSVTVQVDQQLTSTASGADIDGFANGAFTTVPAAWSSPSGTVGSEETYGHWGISSDDTSDMPLDFSNGANFVSASTSPVTVFSHTGPVNGVGVGQGTTSVIYRAEISSLQEAGTDYTATVTYVATPVF